MPAPAGRTPEVIIMFHDWLVFIGESGNLDDFLRLQQRFGGGELSNGSKSNYFLRRTPL